MSSKKAKRTTVGFKYYMGMLMGLCRGGVDELLEIRVGDREAWKGSITGSAPFGIDKEELFGGTKAEGGIAGRGHVMMGEDNEQPPGWVRDLIGGDCSALRGVTTLMFDGLVCSMSPYPKPWKMKSFRARKGWDGGVWYESKVQIDIYVTGKNNVRHLIKAMNPAHIVYQACTDRNWGRGIPRELMDDASFRYAADTLFNENFGICIGWKRQDTLDSFVQKMLDHMGAMLFVDKTTGKMRLKLIREDYVYNDLPIFNDDSGLLSVSESRVSAGSETVNEVIVRYFDPISNQESSVREQNLATISSSGAMFSKTNEYLGIPSPELAHRIAKRDLRYTSLPLRVFTMTLDRKAYKVQPGDVIRIQSRQRGIVEIAVRVGAVEDGTLTNGAIKVAAVEDVFTMPLNGTGVPQVSTWEPPDRRPTVARRFVYEVPYVHLYRTLPKAEFNALPLDDGFYGMAAEKPSSGMMAYDIDTSIEGGQWSEHPGGDFTPVGTLTSDIDYLDTKLWVGDVSLYHEIETPCAAYIGTEIVLVKDKSLNGGIGYFTIERGIYDTIPARHYKGNLIWFFEFSIGSDYQEYVAGTRVLGKCRPWSLSGGKLPADQAPVDMVQMNLRKHRPYPPGYVFGETQGTSTRWYENFRLDRTHPMLRITWNHRDRISQEDQMIWHDVADIGPERGTTYIVRVYNGEGRLIREEGGIEGKGWSYMWAQAMRDMGVNANWDDSDYQVVVRLWSRRDDVDSWQYYQVNLNVADVRLYLQGAQLAEQRAAQHSYAPVNGTMMAAQSQQQANQTDEKTVRGNAMADVASQSGQESFDSPPLGYQIAEFNYLQLLRDGLPTSASRVMSVAARPSDRLTDEHHLLTTLANADGTTVGDYHDAGGQPWTPWILTTENLEHLATEIAYTQSSSADGVPLQFKPGDTGMIDKEMVRVESVTDGKLTIARGVADTIPARHRAGVPLWLVSRQHGGDDVSYDDVANVSVKLRPIVHTIDQVPVDQLRTSLITMAYRYRRPYLPGLFLADGDHWFKGVDTLVRGPLNSETGTYQMYGRDIPLTWRHRNRLSQGERAIEHQHDTIPVEPGVKYRLEVSYLKERIGGGGTIKETSVVIRDVTVEGESWTYRKEWVEEDGNAIGRAMHAPEAVTATIKLSAIRGNDRSWQTYLLTLRLPSYLRPANVSPPEPFTSGAYPTGGGDFPFTSGVTPWNPGGDGNSGTGRPDPNPPSKPDTGDKNPHDPSTRPPQPQPGPDPEDPATPVVPEPDNPDKGGDKDKPKIVGEWSKNYGRNWANSLPDVL